MSQQINLFQNNTSVLQVTNGKLLCCAKNWIHTPSASGSYGRQDVRQKSHFKIV